jgi:hypothetical protein
MIVCKKYKIFNFEDMKSFLDNCKFGESVLLIRPLVDTLDEIYPERMREILENSEHIIKSTDKDFSVEQKYCLEMVKLIEEIVSLKENPTVLIGGFKGQIFAYKPNNIFYDKIKNLVSQSINLSKKHRMYNTSPLLIVALVKMIEIKANIRYIKPLYDELLMIPEKTYRLSITMALIEYLKEKYKDPDCDKTYISDLSQILLEEVKRIRGNQKDYLKEYIKNVALWRNGIYYEQEIEKFTVYEGDLEVLLQTLNDNRDSSYFNVLTNVKILLIESIVLLNLPHNNKEEEEILSEIVTKFQSEIIELIERSKIERDDLLEDMKKNPDKYFPEPHKENVSNEVPDEKKDGDKK